MNSEYTGRKERKEQLITCTDCGYEFTKEQLKKHDMKECQGFLKMGMTYKY